MGDIVVDSSSETGREEQDIEEQETDFNEEPYTEFEEFFQGWGEDELFPKEKPFVPEYE